MGTKADVGMLFVFIHSQIVSHLWWMWIKFSITWR